MTRSDNVRLGLFLVISALLAVAVTIFFVVRYKSRPKLACVTYFDESVAGLAPGNTVRFRGVDVGRVEGISFIPDNSDYIEVRFEIYLDIVGGLGGDVKRLKALTPGEQFSLNDAMRVRLAANFITGLASLQIEPVSPPPPVLTITTLPDRVYLPSAHSRVNQMEESAQGLLIRLPVMIDHIDQLAVTLNATVEQAPVNELLGEMRTTLATSSTQLTRTGDDLHRLLDEKGPLIAVLGQLDRMLATSDIDGSLRETRATLGDLRLLITDLRSALPQFMTTAEYLGGLLRNLQDEPESLIFGPRSK